MLTPTHVVILRSQAEKDPKLIIARESNNGRKVLVNEIYQKTEQPISKPVWTAATCESEKTPVLETGVGGIEIATFSEKAGQDRHMHRLSTEIYTLLRGTMTIEVDGDRYVLSEGDEVVVLPGAVHEVLPSEDEPFLCRVHAVNCYGNLDKYVEHGGRWCQAETVKALDSPSA